MHILKNKGSARDVMFVGYFGMYAAAWGYCAFVNLTRTTVYSFFASLAVFLIIFLKNPDTRHQTIQGTCAIVFVLVCLWIPFRNEFRAFRSHIPNGRFATRVEKAGTFFLISIKDVLKPIVPGKESN